MLVMLNFIFKKLVDILYYNERPISIELPNFVHLVVTETDPGLKGDTAGGTGGKKAIMETGLQVTVPLFIEIGEKLKIDTRVVSNEKIQESIESLQIRSNAWAKQKQDDIKSFKEAIAKIYAKNNADVPSFKFYLNDKFEWSIENDNHDVLCLIPKHK